MADKEQNQDTIVIMQLSDLHFGISDNPKNFDGGHHFKNRQSVEESFLKSFNSIPDDWKPDILVITGDIAFEGKTADYEKAKDFLTKFLNLDGQKIQNNDIVICPGNHDVYINSREIKKPLARLKKDKLLSEHSSEEMPHILTPDFVQNYIYKFDEYADFCYEFHIEALDNSANASEAEKEDREQEEKKLKYLYGFRKVKGISFIALNSEWDYNVKIKDGNGNFTKADNAVGCLRLGVDLFYDSISKVNENDIVIVLFHRPIDHMHISEYKVGNENMQDLINRNAHLVLNGHEHKNSNDRLHMGNAAYFTCGTFHNNRTIDNEYCFQLFKILIKYDKKLSKRFCIRQVYKYVWNNNKGIKQAEWKLDRQDEPFLLGPQNATEYSFSDKNNNEYHIDQKKLTEDTIAATGVNETLVKSLSVPHVGNEYEDSNSGAEDTKNDIKNKN